MEDGKVGCMVTKRGGRRHLSPPFGRERPRLSVTYTLFGDQVMPRLAQIARYVLGHTYTHAIESSIPPCLRPEIMTSSQVGIYRSTSSIPRPYEQLKYKRDDIISILDEELLCFVSG